MNNATAADAVTDPSDAGPAFTRQDELAELASLTIDEITEAQRDLTGLTDGMSNLTVSSSGRGARKGKRRGSASSAHDCPMAMPLHLIQLEVELSAIPLDRKGAYLEALQRCPDFITDEHKTMFLEREDLDASRAAQRLILYWETRRITFGPGRWFLPMTLSGAMKDEVADMKRHCPMILLPDPDLSGRTILFFNPQRRDFAKFSEGSEMRALFYLLETLLVDPAVRRLGFVGIANIKDVQRNQLSFTVSRYMFQLINHVMPIKMRCAHLCNGPAVYNYVIYPVLRTFMGRSMRLRWIAHYGTEASILADLEGYRLPPSCLPTELGGEVTFSIERWIADQSVRETMVAMAASASKAAEAEAFNRTLETTVLQAAKKRKPSCELEVLQQPTSLDAIRHVHEHGGSGTSANNSVHEHFPRSCASNNSLANIFDDEDCDKSGKKMDGVSASGVVPKLKKDELIAGSTNDSFGGGDSERLNLDDIENALQGEWDEELFGTLVSDALFEE